MVKREIPWEEMQLLWQQGTTYQQLAQRYGVSTSTIGKRARREDWRSGKQVREQLKNMTLCLRRQVEQRMQEELGTRELRELSAVLRELMNLQRELEERQPESVRVLLEGETEEWSV